MEAAKEKREESKEEVKEEVAEDQEGPCQPEGTPHLPIAPYYSLEVMCWAVNRVRKSKAQNLNQNLNFIGHYRFAVW